MLVTLTLLLGLAASASTALTPSSADPPASVLLSWAQGDEVFYPLSPGQRLEFPAHGPIELSVQTRMRFVDGANPVAPPRLSVLGDGVLFMTIEIPRQRDERATLYDELGGAPGEPVLTLVQVPAGGQVLGLRAPTEGPPLLVRVTDAGAPEAPTATELSADQATPEEVVAREPVTGPVPAAQVPPPRERPHTLLGPTIGMGAPTRGDEPVVFLGAQVRVPLNAGTLDLGASVGHYRILVDRPVPLVDAYGGARALDVDWSTDVLPLSLDLVTHAPAQRGPRPFIGGGVAVLVAWRRDGAHTTRTTTVGGKCLGGVDAPAGPGRVSAAVAWNGARARFGERHSAPAETLATTRLDLSYLFAF